MGSLWRLLFLLSLAWAEYIPPGPAYECPKVATAIHPCVCKAPGDKGLTISCENTNIASLSVGLKNLAILKKPIELLTISKCNIARLYGTLLHRLKVRILRIEETPLRVIEAPVFLGVNRTLQVLQVVNSELLNLPAEAFKILGNLTVLEIHGHHISNLSSATFADSMLRAHVEKIRITNGNLTEIPLDLFAGFKRLKVLDLHGNRISALKKGQFKGLRDLEVLDLSYNELSKVEAAHVSDLTKLGDFNVSNNAVQELARGTFARNSVLKHLNMNSNKIRRLDSNSFRGMRFLRTAKFSDNEINDIGRGTFNSLGRLSKVHLARNKLKKLDYQMFFQHTFLDDVDVSSNEIADIQKVAFKGLYLTKINISHNLVKSIEPGAFEECSNITLLDLSYNAITSIPAKAFDPTTYAHVFQLSYNNLTSLSQVPLHNMTGIKVLNVSHNQLRTVPRNTFPKLYELHTIDLSHNELTDIANGVFQVLFSIRELNLSFNHLETLKSSVFGAVPTLIHMDLSNNRLRDISRGAFARLASLRELKLENNELDAVFQLPTSLSSLDMSNNRIENIPSGTETWPTMNSLLFLNLRNNSIGNSLERGSFRNLLSLRQLDLSYNGISKTPWESLGDLSSLQYLELEGNSLKELTKSAFGRLPVVFELNLANNEIDNITAKAFDGLLQLLMLNLTNNKLSHIPNGAFQGLVSLRTLDLSHNSLEKLDNKTNGLLEDCLSLERVDLSHNQISFITRTTFPSSPYIPYKLREINLSYNSMPVLTYDIVFGSSKLEVLNLSHNMINEVRRGVLGNLTALKVLDLSHNQLTEFPDKYFGPPKNLTELYMSANKLRALPVEELTKLKSQIKLIDVRNNDLGHFDLELIELLKNETRIEYSGNPIECNCLLRPVKRWLSQRPVAPEEWSAVACYGPSQLRTRHLPEVSENSMECPLGLRVAEEFSSVSDDVQFREVKQTKNELSIQWLVLSKKDIGDFYIVVRTLNKTNPVTVYEKLLPYDARKEVITKSDVVKHLKEFGVVTPAQKTSYELCLYAVDSQELILQSSATLCPKLKDFDWLTSAANRENALMAVIIPLVIYFLV